MQVIVQVVLFCKKEETLSAIHAFGGDLTWNIRAFGLAGSLKTKCPCGHSGIRAFFDTQFSSPILHIHPKITGAFGHSGSISLYLKMPVRAFGHSGHFGTQILFIKSMFRVKVSPPKAKV